jgi:hypothetical protein
MLVLYYLILERRHPQRMKQMKRWEKALEIEQSRGNNIAKEELINSQKCPYYYFLMEKDSCHTQDKDCDECWEIEVKIEP